MKQFKIKSKLKISKIIILVFGGLLIFFLGYYLMSTSLETEYPQITLTIFGVIFILFGLLGISSFLFIDSYILDNEKLTINSLLGYPKKIIYLKDILSFTEIEKENKQGKWKDLTIYTNSKKVKLSSSMINNYFEFKKVLVKGKRRNTEIESLWEIRTNRRFGIGFIIFGAIFLTGAIIAFSNRNKQVSINELKTIQGQITNEIKIKKGSKSSRLIEIKLAKYPKYTFTIGGVSYAATYKNRYLENVKTGDTLEIDIKIDDYEKKISKEKELSFTDKYINYQFITVYGLRDNSNKYLTLRNYNKEYKSDMNSIGYWILVLFSFGITGYGIFFTIKNKKPAANN